jgi:hypothetical protein
VVLALSSGLAFGLGAATHWSSREQEWFRVVIFGVLTAVDVAFLLFTLLAAALVSGSR